MKFSHILSGAAAIALAVASIGVQAGLQTSTMNVLANVVPKCTIDPITDLNFGTYVQESGNVDATTSISVTCPTGTAYTIALGGLQGTQRFMASGPDNLEYQLYSNAGRTVTWGSTIGTDTVAGIGTGAAIPTTVYGRVLDNAANRLIPAGAYNSVVTVTVAY